MILTLPAMWSRLLSDVGKEILDGPRCAAGIGAASERRMGASEPGADAVDELLVREVGCHRHLFSFGGLVPASVQRRRAAAEELDDNGGGGRRDGRDDGVKLQPHRTELPLFPLALVGEGDQLAADQLLAAFRRVAAINHVRNKHSADRLVVFLQHEPHRLLQLQIEKLPVKPALCFGSAGRGGGTLLDWAAVLGWLSRFSLRCNELLQSCSFQCSVLSLFLLVCSLLECSRPLRGLFRLFLGFQCLRCQVLILIKLRRSP
mmetsp:Transcript_31825/g.64551  ORF Transcript_31825/g.64551 Transcript_31825/m.64551 type:complete len:261 (+) Transcript_31825:34-816(+)